MAIFHGPYLGFLLNFQNCDLKLIMENRKNITGNEKRGHSFRGEGRGTGVLVTMLVTTLKCPNLIAKNTTSGLSIRSSYVCPGEVPRKISRHKVSNPGP